MTSKDKLSIIVPCYCEEKVLPLFYDEMKKISATLSYIDFEFIFVDDGSKDATLLVIKSLTATDSRVKYVSSSRNFGKEAGIYAGLNSATGDYIAIMDADLQDPPALLEEMYQTVKNSDYDCVATRRVSREGEPPIRSFFARCFYKLINQIASTEIVDGARDFRLMTRQMVDAILSVPEYNRFSKGLFSWVGFNTKWLEYKNIERAAGETKWSFWKLFLYSIEGIIAYSTVPLAFASIVGVLFFLGSLIGIVFIIARQLLYHNSAFGWPSTICILLFITGIQLLCMGILGSYLAKTYLETKQRPIYIVRDTNTSVEPSGYPRSKKTDTSD